jgi:hypothetical protein
LPKSLALGLLVPWLQSAWFWLEEP